MSAILPKSEQDDLPTGFSIVGHIGALPSFPQYMYINSRKKPTPNREHTKLT